MTTSNDEIRALLLALDQRLDRLTAEVASLKKALAAQPASTPKAPAPQAPKGAPTAAKPAAKAPAPKKPAEPKGPEPLRLAFIGGGLHGTKAISNWAKLKDCRIAYVAEVDSKRGAARAKELKALTGQAPKVAVDFREALLDPQVDAAIVCTPHHWHALAAVEALRAGKHVYIEKPVTQAFFEGPILRAAAEKSGKVVMPGTQLRSNASLAAAGEFMRAGGLGRITLAHCVTHKNRAPLPLSNDMQVPESVDYDLWLGPRPDRPLTRSKFHYHWHWFWDFGNGALGNNGVHRIDAVRMALGLKGRGDLALSVGGRFGQPDPSETPNNQLALHRYGDLWILQDVLGVEPQAYRGMENAVIFHGEKGVIVYKSGAATLCAPDFTPISVFEGKQGNHYAAFLKAIRANQAEASRADLDEAILSGDLCHFGNISHRVGAEATDAKILAEFKKLKVPEFVYERFAALRENIRAAGDGEAPLTLGKLLNLQEGPNPFVKAPAAATKLLQAEERPPFKLPEISEL